MGNCACARIFILETILSSTGDSDYPSEFKMMRTSVEAEKQYGKSILISNHNSKTTGMLIKDEIVIELRVLLEEEIGKQYFCNYLNNIGSLCWYDLWKNIEEYKKCSYNQQNLYIKACNIYDQFIEPYPCIKLEGITSDLLMKLESNNTPNAMTNIINKHNEEDVNSIFDETYSNVLQKLCELYIDFKTTIQYVLMEQEVQHKYNRVVIKDFAYYKVLGQGSFGLVVLCKKKSTGFFYAMKIQDKEALYTCCGDQPWRVCAEKNAFACCKHPYIVELNYTLHSSRLVMMVMTLGTAGDLSTIISRFGGKLPNNYVRFYAAELVSVLAYIHSQELIYRDLKPANVLLQGDGHIMLTDFGTVADANGRTYAIFSDAAAASPFINNIKMESNFMLQEATDDFDEFSIEDTRANSIVGTGLYMAPEMLSLCMDNSHSYTIAVDWWSLGATMYKLLTGLSAISKQLVSLFLKVHSTSHFKELVSDMNCIDYKLLQHIPDACSIIRDFLEINPENRLGSGGYDGVHDIKTHIYFEDIDWDLIEKKELSPPYIPLVEEANGIVHHSIHSTTNNNNNINTNNILNTNYLTEKTLQELIISCKKKDWLYKRDTDMSEIDSYFQKWDYINPSILQIEVEEQTNRSISISMSSSKTRIGNSNGNGGYNSGNVSMSQSPTSKYRKSLL